MGEEYPTVDSRIIKDLVGLAKDNTLKLLLYPDAVQEYDTVTIPAGGGATLIDTGVLSEPILVDCLILGTDYNLLRIYVHIYNKNGDEIHIDTVMNGAMIYGYLTPEYLNNLNISKETPYFKLVQYDTTNNNYVIILKKPILCYGIKIMSDNFDSADHTLSYYLVYFKHI